ncbi:MAG: peroxiredoxin [Desulfobacterales bacterium]|jgi:peroxiredoxin (alkyl hydroperoxide reductase subunit C)|nr:peroxiredoxin [Desulfobacterales bacterium]MDD4463846.1 peroxiredoxin [Desulfobacterales bacterium]MDY0377550.1 peroxiredoxin [Desulfobacterales bacterium]
MMKKAFVAVMTVALFLIAAPLTYGLSEAFKDSVYNPGELKPVDSQLKVKVGEPAPDFTLPSLSGEKITLSSFRDNKNVVLSFVPAAWTPVCSDQWPGYNIVKDIFDQNDAILLGITVDNIPTLYSWVREMGQLWFPVLSDFWPHGAVADAYGVLRSDGVTERALLFIDKKGVLRHAHVGDINVRPPMQVIVTELEKMNQAP